MATAAKAAFQKAIAEGEARARLAAAEAAAAEQTKKLREGDKRAAEAVARKEAILNMSPVRIPHGGKRHRLTAKRFCSCVKKVKSQKKKEGSAIAICTSSLLWPHGRTLHSVSCRRKKSIKTQKRTTRKK
jgi:acyl-CoA hydrolase